MRRVARGTDDVNSAASGSCYYSNMVPFRRNVEEIAHDRALQVSGALLAAAELVTLWYWFTTGVPALLARGTDPVCWPFFESCRSLHAFGAGTIRMGLAIY